MKRLLTSAVALSLILGGSALAQDRDKHKEGGGKHQQQQQQQQHQGGGGGKHDRADKPNRGGDRGDRAGRQDNRNPNWQRNDNRDRNPNWQRDRNDRNWDRNRNDRNPNWDRNRNDRNPNWDRRNDRNPNWNRGPRERPRNFDRRHYQRNAWAQHRFRKGYYHRPPGWYYRRWTYGQILPFAFFARDYWLNDWYDYDLPVPPYGYEWVRYGDDAILVDVRTGMILQVIYGVFY